MATKRIVPRADGEGGIGRSDKRMGPSFFTEFGGSQFVRILETSLTTSNATPTAIYQKTIADNESTQIFALIVCGDPTGISGGSYARNCMVYKNGSSNAAIRGSQVLATDIESSASLNVTWTIVGTNVLQCLVTGLASTTLNWRGFFTAITAA